MSAYQQRGVSISISFHGEPQVQRTIFRTSERAMHALPAFENILHRINRAASAQFNSKGKRSGEPWPPLAASTLRQRRAMGIRHRRPLEVTGRLMAAVKAKVTSGDAIREASDTHAIWGMVSSEDFDYPIYHQSRKPRTRLPRRRFLALTNKDRLGIQKVLQRWIVTGRLL